MKNHYLHIDICRHIAQSFVTCVKEITPSRMAMESIAHDGSKVLERVAKIFTFRQRKTNEALRLIATWLWNMQNAACLTDPPRCCLFTKWQASPHSKCVRRFIIAIASHLMTQRPQLRDPSCSESWMCSARCTMALYYVCLQSVTWAMRWMERIKTFFGMTEVRQWHIMWWLKHLASCSRK